MMMKQIFTKNPGTRILLHCATADDTEEIISSICSSIPDTFREKTRLNTCAVLSMDIIGDDNPNGFRDLAVLCNRLVISAGRRSHFAGLLLLNISSLLKKKEDQNRLKALGEVLSVKGGLASQCITVFYGADTEKEYLVAADCLDFDGDLMVEHVENPRRGVSIQAMLKEADMSISSDQAVLLLQSTIAEVQNEGKFDTNRFFRSCAAQEGIIITENSIQAALDDPYSYINRFKKMKTILSKEKEDSGRRIGF